VLHTLGDLLLHLGSNPPQELQLNALTNIAEGLDYIHKQGIAHGDKGTVISYSRQVEYVVSFDGYGPEENETIESLKKAVERSSYTQI